MSNINHQQYHITNHILSCCTKCRTLPMRCWISSSHPKHQRKLHPLPHNFNIHRIQKHRCYRTWLSLNDGDVLKCNSTSFVKGDDHSKQHLIRHIHTQICATQTKLSGKDLMKNKSMIFQCTELPDSDESTPISPPNIIKGRNFWETEVVASRNHYHMLLMKSQTKRKYVKGALYSIIMFDVTDVYDVRRFKSSYIFEIKTPNECNTVMKVCDLSSHCTELLSTIITLNTMSLPKSLSNCWKASDTGDTGIMHTFGMRKHHLYYACMNNPSTKKIYGQSTFLHSSKQ